LYSPVIVILRFLLHYQLLNDLLFIANMMVLLTNTEAQG